ncbi:hypothetical protein D3C85_1761080 [compost metagenome]
MRQQFFFSACVAVPRGPGRSRKRGLELRYIEVKRRIGQPSHRLRIGMDKLISLRPGLAQLKQQLTQGIARLRLGGIRPE